MPRIVSQDSINDYNYYSKCVWILLHTCPEAEYKEGNKELCVCLRVHVNAFTFFILCIYLLSVPKGDFIKAIGQDPWVERAATFTFF